MKGYDFGGYGHRISLSFIAESQRSLKIGRFMPSGSAEMQKHSTDERQNSKGNDCKALLYEIDLVETCEEQYCSKDERQGHKPIGQLRSIRCSSSRDW